MNDIGKVNQLLKLRESVFEGIMPLLDQSDIDPSERFELYSRLAQSRGTLDLYEKAFRAAQALEQGSDKLRAYLDLLADIDEELQSDSSAQDTSSDQELTEYDDKTV
jgi:hypothetical protein